MPCRRRPPPSSDAVPAFWLTAERSRDFAGSFRSLPIRSLGRQWFGSRTLGRHHGRRCRNISSEAKSLAFWFRERAEHMESGSISRSSSTQRGPTESLARKASGERRHVAFVNGPRSFAKKDDDYELPNGLTGCDGFGFLRRECVRGRQSARRPHAEVRRRLCGLPSDLRFVLPSLRNARRRREKGTCQVHALLCGLRGLLQAVCDVVRTRECFLSRCGGMLREML